MGLKNSWMFDIRAMTDLKTKPSIEVRRIEKTHKEERI